MLDTAPLDRDKPLSCSCSHLLSEKKERAFAARQRQRQRQTAITPLTRAAEPHKQIPVKRVLAVTS